LFQRIPIRAPDEFGMKRVAIRPPIGYTLNMRIVIAGEGSWPCDGLAAGILRRLLNRYGADIVIAHGGRPGVDEAFSQAAHGSAS
jgi:hypothetical protein